MKEQLACILAFRFQSATRTITFYEATNPKIEEDQKKKKKKIVSHVKRWLRYQTQTAIQQIRCNWITIINCEITLYMGIFT